MRRAVLFVAALAVLSLASVACDNDEDAEPAAAAIAERWLRAGEDAQSNVVVYERRLPPDLSDLLNPDATADTPEEDRVAFPVHPDGSLVGSYVLRRAEGRHLVWLIFDVAVPRPDVERLVADQLDETPWQVTGMQSDPSMPVVRFQSSLGYDIEGSAIVQPSPATDSFQLTVDREGDQVTLDVDRSAPSPVIEASLEDDLTVRRVDAGAARRAGLQERDRIVAVDDTEVETRRELAEALQDLAQAGEPVVGLTYVIDVQPERPPDEPLFVMPDGRQLPSRFPALEAWDGLTVLDFAWVAQQGGRAYQSSMVSTQSPTVVADSLRDALEAEGWEIVDDRPMGFATVLELFHAGDGLGGSVQIDAFPPDEDFTLVVVQLQTAAGGGN